MNIGNLSGQSQSITSQTNKSAHPSKASSYLMPLDFEDVAGLSSSLVKMPLNEKQKNVSRYTLFLYVIFDL